MTYKLGLQTYTYREFDLEELLAELEALPVAAVELYSGHVSPDASAAEIESVKDSFADIGVDIEGFGVHGFDAPSEVEPILSFVDELGADYCSVDFEPGDDATVSELCSVADDYDLKLGLHNHGPDPWSNFGSVDEVLEAIEGQPPVLGACVDTGHYLRVNETPAETIPRLGERVNTFHLKDFADPDTEVIPGEGQLDLKEVFELLDANTNLEQALMIEYEEDEDNPTPAIEQAAAAFEAAQS